LRRCTRRSRASPTFSSSPSCQHLLSRQTAGLDLLVSVNPGSAAWALETFGYFFMSMALVVATPVFGGGQLERWIRGLFLANGLGLPAAVVYVYTMDALHPLALAYLAVWCITFPIAMVLLAALFQRANTESTRQHTQSVRHLRAAVARN
jgi:hypothetical protein